MAKKPPRLTRSAQVDLPVVEASGLVTSLVEGRVRVLVVGDRTDALAAGSYEPGAGIVDWQTVDLSGIDGWPQGAADSQLEAIAADGGSLVAFMREDPPVVLIVDTAARNVRARIALTAPPGSALKGIWDDPSSRGEGLVLLRGGRLLVAMEKRPRALVEFAAIGQGAGEVSRYDFLESGESWDAPTGDVEYVPAAIWKLRGAAKRALGDISALAVGRDHSLWLLSDKSRCIARLTLEVPLRAGVPEITQLHEVWRLPKGAIKPEGFAALDSERFLVAMDTGSVLGNGMIVERPRGTDRRPDG
jgi:hypothetical protein